MNLASTDIQLKSRAEESMKDFRSRLLALAEEKSKEEESEGIRGRGMMITTVKKDDGTIKFHVSDPPTVHPEDVPVFKESPRDFGETVAGTLVDVGLLAIYSIVAFSITFVAFLRYDVR